MQIGKVQGRQEMNCEEATEVLMKLDSSLRISIGTNNMTAIRRLRLM